MNSDARLLNRLVNDPDTLRALAPGYANVDVSAFFDNPRNVMLGDASGVAIFAHVGDGVYEGHYIFPKTTKHKLARCRAFLDEMFTRYGAQTIVGHTPAEILPARILSRALGFTPRGHSVSASGRSCVDYALEREQWLSSISETGSISAPSAGE